MQVLGWLEYTPPIPSSVGVGTASRAYSRRETNRGLIFHCSGGWKSKIRVLWSPYQGHGTKTPGTNQAPEQLLPRVYRSKPANPLTPCCCSVAKSFPTLCGPTDCSLPGSSVHLLEFDQTYVHRVGDAIQPSHPLSSPSPPALNLSQHQGLFQ